MIPDYMKLLIYKDIMNSNTVFNQHEKRIGLSGKVFNKHEKRIGSFK